MTYVGLAVAWVVAAVPFAVVGLYLAGAWTRWRDARGFSPLAGALRVLGEGRSAGPPSGEVRASGRIGAGGRGCRG